MYLNGFSVRVHPGTEVPGGYVELTHGTPYTLHLRNQNPTACDAQVFVDGKDVGTFRLHAGAGLPLERPSNDTGRFTFYRAASLEAQQAGVTSISSQDYGLIRVVFTPEKEVRPVQSVTYTAPLWSAPQPPLAPDYTVTYAVAGAAAAPTCSAGITGLSGHSQQQFVSVGPLDYDYTRQTTIHLRLVECSAAPRPVVSVATAIPPAVVR